jgi:hypothetical protein
MGTVESVMRDGLADVDKPWPELPTRLRRLYMAILTALREDEPAAPAEKSTEDITAPLHQPEEMP